MADVGSQQYNCNNVYATSATSDNLSRHDMLNWIDVTLQDDYKKNDKLSDGESHSQAVDLVYPKVAPQKKVKFRMNLERKFIQNLKVVQTSSKNIDCDKELPLNRIFNYTIKLDHNWNSKILTILKQYLKLHSSFAWLSTLGGAMSSLGDSDREFSIRAGTMASKQYKIAEKLGDKKLMIRCKIYFALALCQLGEKDSSKLVLDKFVEPYLKAMSQVEVISEIKLLQYAFMRLNL